MRCIYAPHTYHQLINDSDDWIEHILVTVPVA